MTKKQYAFREGARIGGGLKPEVVGSELERLRKKVGTLRAADVVEVARPEDAPLHPHFTWDDSIAGENWRRQEARQLIRAVQIVRGDETRPAYEHVPSIDTQNGTYEPGEVLIQHPDMYALALEEALASLSAAQARVGNLRRYADGDEDRMAVIVLAASALQTAEAAIRQLH